MGSRGDHDDVEYNIFPPPPPLYDIIVITIISYVIAENIKYSPNSIICVMYRIIYHIIILCNIIYIK